MCYVLYLALPNNQNLSRFTTDLLKPVENKKPDEVSGIFTLNSVYYIGSQSGCSCDFRYWGSDFGFQGPQDWAQESADDVKILATRQLFDMIKALLVDADRIELAVKWITDGWTSIGWSDLDVSLVNAETFYIFTNTKMRIFRCAA